MILPAGQDPAQILADPAPPPSPGRSPTSTRPLADLVINTEVARWSRWLQYPEGQIHALRAAAPLIAAMPPAQVARQVARLAAILRLDHATVTKAVTDALSDLPAGPVTVPSREFRAQRANRRPGRITHAALPPKFRSAATQARVEPAAVRTRESSQPPIRYRSAPR